MGSLSTQLGALLVAVLVLLGGLDRAEAQTPEARNRARQLYESAQRLFDAGNYAAAESTFRAAYETVPNPVVLRAIAAAQERQGNIGAAVQTLERYLREAPPNAPDRAQVEAHLRELSARPATLAVASTPPGAEIFVDGRPTGQTTPADVSLTAGQHTVELRMDGYQPVQQAVNALPATRMRLDVPLHAVAAGGGGEAAGGGGSTSGGGGGESTDPSVTVWVVSGVAALGLVSGTVFGFLALSEQSNFDNAPSHEIADRGETFALVADISFGIAAAAAITAIVLYIVERSSGGRGTETASLFREGDLSLDLGAFGDPNGGGIAAQLRF